MTPRFLALAIVGAGLIAVGACGRRSAEVSEPILGCEPDARLTPICEFRAPEDLQLLPSGSALLIGEYGGNTGTQTGSLKLMHLADRSIEVLYPREDAHAPGVAGEVWGDPACPGPPGERFAAHGLHVSQRRDGRTQALVVNHVDRESVEFFELEEAAAGVSARWRGCAVAPDPLWLNDLVGLRDGGFIATHMIDAGAGLTRIRIAEWLGLKTGYAVAWSRQDGWQPIPGTEGGVGNGIEIDAEERVLFINFYIGDQVVAFDRETETRLWETRVSQPDNSSWTPDGTLLVASHNTPITDTLAYTGVHDRGCPLPFSIVEIDPKDGSSRTIVERSGAPMGGVTTAVQVGDELYLGSFTGDRLGVLHLP